MSTTPQGAFSMNSPRRMQLRREYFDLVATDRKTIEIRVAYNKFGVIQAGQYLRFDCGKLDRVLVHITAVNTYSTFEEMLANEDAGLILPDHTPDEILEICREIYPPEKEQLGVLAIHITRCP